MIYSTLGDSFSLEEGSVVPWGDRTTLETLMMRRRGVDGSG